MARPALEVDEDNALGFAEAGAACVILFGGGLLQTEKIRQAESENRGASNPEQLAPSDAVARILPCETGNDKHNGTSGECLIASGERSGGISASRAAFVTPCIAKIVYPDDSHIVKSIHRRNC